MGREQGWRAAEKSTWETHKHLASIWLGHGDHGDSCVDRETGALFSPARLIFIMAPLCCLHSEDGSARQRSPFVRGSMSVQMSVSQWLDGRQLYFAVSL